MTEGNRTVSLTIFCSEIIIRVMSFQPYRLRNRERSLGASKSIMKARILKTRQIQDEKRERIQNA